MDLADRTLDDDAHIMGGPGAFVDNECGPSIIHSGWIHSPLGLQVGGAFIVRRSYPDGASGSRERTPLVPRIYAFIGSGALEVR
jgi:hypothetical protein